jgi:hypothetical protein
MIRKPTKKKSKKKLNAIVPKNGNGCDLANLYIKKIKDGRPTKYRKDMCYKVIKLMAEGMSKENVACYLGVSFETLRSWCVEVNEDGSLNTNFKKDFLVAIKIGEQLSKLWWMETGRINLFNKDFNVGLFVINMRNRWGWHGKDKLDIDIKQENINTEKKEIKVTFEYDKNDIQQIITGLVEYGIIEPDQLDTTTQIN